jgi:hypothetical protein
MDGCGCRCGGGCPPYCCCGPPNHPLPPCCSIPQPSRVQSLSIPVLPRQAPFLAPRELHEPRFNPFLALLLHADDEPLENASSAVLRNRASTRSDGWFAKPWAGARRRCARSAAMATVTEPIVVVRRSEGREVGPKSD